MVGDAVAFSAGASLGSLNLWQPYYVAAANFVNHSAFSVLTSPGGACLNGAGGATGLTVINDLSFETVYLKTAGSYIEPYYVDGTQARLTKQLPVLSGWLTIQPWTGQTHATTPIGPASAISGSTTKADRLHILTDVLPPAANKSPINPAAAAWLDGSTVNYGDPYDNLAQGGAVTKPFALGFGSVAGYCTNNAFSYLGAGCQGAVLVFATIPLMM